MDNEQNPQLHKHSVMPSCLQLSGSSIVVHISKAITAKNTTTIIAISVFSDTLGNINCIWYNDMPYTLDTTVLDNL